MTLYNTETDKTFTIQDIKKMVIPEMDTFSVFWVILQASYMKENDIKVIGLTRPELGRIVTRLYDKSNKRYYSEH